MSLRSEEYYTPADLNCGSEVVVYGRKCQIYDCDDHTKQWYRENLGVEQRSLALKSGNPSIQYQPTPPYMGYGTEEDSMGSVISLQPKQPKFDMKKMFKQDMHILRFNAKLVSTEPDDESRTFIISFYCGDDTI
jgi:EF-hand domain-containing protein 1